MNQSRYSSPPRSPRSRIYDVIFWHCYESFYTFRMHVLRHVSARADERGRRDGGMQRRTARNDSGPGATSTRVDERTPLVRSLNSSFHAAFKLYFSSPCPSPCASLPSPLPEITFVRYSILPGDPSAGEASGKMNGKRGDALSQASCTTRALR